MAPPIDVINSFTVDHGNDNDGGLGGGWDGDASVGGGQLVVREPGNNPTLWYTKITGQDGHRHLANHDRTIDRITRDTSGALEDNASQAHLSPLAHLGTLPG